MTAINGQDARPATCVAEQPATETRADQRGPSVRLVAHLVADSYGLSVIGT